MTTFTLVNLIGYLTLVVPYLVKYLMNRKEEQQQKNLEAQVSNIKDLSTEELVELTYKLEDLKLRRFGTFGSYGVHVQILAFGIGVFSVNLLHKIL